MDGCAPGFRQAREPAAAARSSACSRSRPADSPAAEIAAERVAGTNRVDRLDLERLDTNEVTVLCRQHAVGARG